MKKKDVLIVGAGPSGLILANELLRRGISVRQVDKRVTPSGSTRAFTIHSRTMEMFDHMAVAPRLTELREVCPGNRFHFKGVDFSEDEVPATDFRRLKNTRFNYYGKVNQNDLEQALRDHLLAQHSYEPEWNVECAGINEIKDSVEATLIHHGDNGRAETASSSWLIGADGVHSVVRQALGGTFEHKEGYLTTMSMADVALHGYKGDDSWVNYYTSDQGFTLLTHLPGDMHRIYLTGEMQRKLEETNVKEAYQWALDFYNTGAIIDEVFWSSVWQIHKIIGEIYVKGKVILCGDATHVHSPAGGQGMNACLQDGFNLGWKLATVIRGEASERILETYESERKPIAEQVAEGANRIHQIVINHDIPVEKRFELTQDPDWHDSSIYWISGLAHTYRGNVYIPEGVTPLEGPIESGDRVPDAVLCDKPPKQRLHDILRHPGFTLVYLPARDVDRLSYVSLVERIRELYRDRIKCIAIGNSRTVEGLGPEAACVDRLGGMEANFGVSDIDRVMVIRPDLVVGYQSSLAESEMLFDYLASWFGPT